MEKEIKELTLLLLYLTSWREKELPEPIRRSWKGYDFDVINELADEGIINQGKRSKSVYLTEKGIELAEKLQKKYGIK